MSGTSVDAVDYALCEISAKHIQLKKLWRAAFPQNLRRRLHTAASDNCTAHELAQLHHDLGRFYARHAMRGAARTRLDLVGLHGQTIFHQPRKPNAATLQIGEPAWLAEALRVPVVSNFRAGDLAAGGEGAPLATMFHCQVFGQRGRHVCVNNLGGISNVTSIDWRRGREPKVAAFDTGPANVLLDIAARHLSNGKLTMDKDGAWAARGKIHDDLVAQWLSHPFFRRSPPKSTGREMFGEVFWKWALREMKRTALSRYDILATLTAFTARSIAYNYERHLSSLPDCVILTGGGAANRMLRHLIFSQMLRLEPSMKIVTSVDLGWPIQSIEAAAFALLAWRRMNGLPGNIPETTGARRAVLLGQVTAG